MEISEASEALIETLKTRGWCFGDIDQVRATIIIQSALNDNCTVDSIESELANMDLRSIGAKSLPDPSALRKSSSLQGPKVLQVSSARDISRSSIEDRLKNSHNRRLLKLNLTDGYSDITAIEFTIVPSIPDDVVPGTKVRLENKAPIRYGILCLNPKVVTVIGGVVQSLHEEWQMNQKYSGFSRSSLRLSQESDTGGPPPFEKLQIEAPSLRFSQQGRFSHYPQSTSKWIGPTAVESGGNGETSQMGKHQNFGLKVDHKNNDQKTASFAKRTEEKPSNSEVRPKEDYPELTSKFTGPTAVEAGGNGEIRPMGKHQNFAERTEEKPSNSERRPKEVAESIPIQNQAAAQKLLQKMSNLNQDDRHSRGRKQRGKGKQEEPAVFTLAEWEKGKSEAKPLIRDDIPRTIRDEDLAWQLQNQFDMEDHVSIYAFLGAFVVIFCGYLILYSKHLKRVISRLGFGACKLMGPTSEIRFVDDSDDPVILAHPFYCSRCIYLFIIFGEMLERIFK
ncbi:hypothetical protein L1049_000295 [Liquidambar formosana]|uniref:RecQ mediated genome instability protein 1 OB-fold domain-containing protein n=1 Tax=Liquidambar formosana TaxID=63359 RepID=A0AAP0NA70_LIQFO